MVKLDLNIHTHKHTELPWGGAAVESNVGSTVEMNGGSEVESTVGSKVGSTVGSEVGSNVGSAVELNGGAGGTVTRGAVAVVLKIIEKVTDVMNVVESEKIHNSSCNKYN